MLVGISIGAGVIVLFGILIKVYRKENKQYKNYKKEVKDFRDHNDFNLFI